MRDSSPRLRSLLALLLLATACTADPPSAPPDGIRPSFAISVAYPATCVPNEIRRTMATLYRVSDLKNEALPAFNRGEQLKQAGDLAGARSEYFFLIDHLLRTFRADSLQQPSQLASVQDGVYYVVAGVSRCAGDPEIDDLATFITGIGNDAPNHNICVVRNTSVDTTCVVPSKGAAVELEANYLWQEALILLQPDLANTDEDLFETDLGTTWSDVWRIRIEPVTAQRNFPQEPMPPAATPTPFGHVAVCTIDKYEVNHEQELSDADLLRLGYSEGESTTAILLEESTSAIDLLNCTEYAGDWDEGVGTSSLAATPVLDSWPARELMRSLRAFGGHARSAFVPRSLYAFDGGIGGRFHTARSYFAAAEDPDVYIRLDPSTEAQGPVNSLTIRQLGTTDVLASRTAFGLTLEPGTCTWTSSHNRVSVTPTEGAHTRLSAGRSTGTALVIASCTRDEVTAADTTVVTVTR